MRTFVIGDIHGGARALNQWMERSGFDFDNDCLIQLGDLVDGFADILDPKDIPLSHQQFFESQLLYHIDGENNCYWHGGFNRFLSFALQRRETFYWDREHWLSALDYHLMKRRNPGMSHFGLRVNNDRSIADSCFH
jgi:hypothetical protein